MWIQLKCRISDTTFYSSGEMLANCIILSRFFSENVAPYSLCNSLHSVETIPLSVKTVANCMQCFMLFAPQRTFYKKLLRKDNIYILFIINKKPHLTTWP